MPRRQRIDLLDIANRANLLSATFAASRGKRSRPAVRVFLSHLDEELNQLATELLDETYCPSPMREFVVRDPKLRIIHAPTFRDRVVHHAIIKQIGSTLDASLVDDTFACRIGKGPIAAVQKAQVFSRRFEWYLKIDISKYFHSIHHWTLLTKLSRRFKGEPFEWLLGRIIGSFQTTQGKGLPIGALTSQHFANVYLDEVDRFLSSSADVGAFVRYMDDILIWCDTRELAKRIYCVIAELVVGRLHIELNRKWQINRSCVGVPFCGFRVFPHAIRLSKRRQRQFRFICEKWERKFLRNEISSCQLQSGYASAYALTQIGTNACGWRRKQMNQHPNPEV
jgi:retron-type reverse transcriptase